MSATSIRLQVFDTALDEKIYSGDYSANELLVGDGKTAGERKESELIVKGLPLTRLVPQSDGTVSITQGEIVKKVASGQVLKLAGGWKIKVVSDDSLITIEIHGDIQSNKIQEDKTKQSTMYKGLFLIVLLAILFSPIWLTHFDIEHEQDAVSKAVSNAMSPGPLHDAHRNATGNCNDCHQDQFESIAIYQCLDCHTMKRHLTREQTGTHPLCVGCHKEHEEPSLLINNDQRLCTQCHVDHDTVKAIASEGTHIEMETISGFPNGHPEFSPVIKQTDPQSGFSFSHKQHSFSSEVKKANNGENLVCRDCHTPADKGVSFEPVKMESACIDCHGLTYQKDKQSIPKKLIHGDMLVNMTIFERETGSVEGAFKELHSAMKQTCDTCHYVPLRPFKNVADLDVWQKNQNVEGISFNNIRFSHKRHEGKNECEHCHAKVPFSEQLGENLLPQKDACGTCHQSEPSSDDQLETPCASCHYFHTIEWDNPYPIDWSKVKKSQ